MSFLLKFYFFFTFLSKSLLSLSCSIEISTFSLLFYWHLCFFLKFLLNYLFSLYCFLKPLLSLQFSTSTFSLLFFQILYFLIAFLLKTLLSFHFSIEISTSSLLFYWNLNFFPDFYLKSLSRAGVLQILRSSTSKSAPVMPVFNDFDFQIALARRRGANFVDIFGSRSFATPAFRTCLCEPSKPRNYGKTQHFAQFLPAKISHVSHLCCKNISAVQHRCCKT